MSIKSILAAYSGDAEGSSGLRLAALMARKYDAHLTGVVWHGPSFLESRYRGYLNQEVLGVLRERDAELVGEIRRDFAARVAAEDLGSRSTFLDLTGRSDFNLAACARGYDVVVMGARAAKVGREHFVARPDVVALRSGRPLILVPQDYAVAEINEHALVAWDGKRAAARALGDAMHILETKSRVTVLTVGDRDALPERPGDDVLALLRRHGIAAEALVRPAGRGGIGRTVLDACAEVGAGLLVMGAYEHSKFSEDILGGVTRDIFDHAQIPVLMSH
ncbi:universal stress protein [Roseitranquillus sediminis]|uniref:universal stress protein n=1 Tax=Roseitranquillus sediminis TaxID=2809051 RepID=UPI001D0BF4D1|nr:universal stress protein [Roseitranquillus sediminis]MBM9593542.1 universal stress protein [Roseitranquillus sediminis]